MDQDTLNATIKYSIKECMYMKYLCVANTSLLFVQNTVNTQQESTKFFWIHNNCFIDKEMCQRYYYNYCGVQGSTHRAGKA